MTTGDCSTIMAKEPTEKDCLEQDMIRVLARLLHETGLSEIEIEKADLKIRVARAPNVAVAAAAGPEIATAAGEGAVLAQRTLPIQDPANHPGVVNSPMVGTAYRAPERGHLPFIEVGARVIQGQTLLIIEAMKIMN